MGTGSAAARLSAVTHRKCTVVLPGVSLLRVEEVKARFDVPNAFAVGARLSISGEVPSSVLMLMTRRAARTVIGYMTESERPGGLRGLSFTAEMALQVVADLLATSFVDAVSQLVNAKVKYSMPEILTGAWIAVLESVLPALGAGHDPTLVVHSTFGDTERTFEGTFLYFLTRPAVERMRSLLDELHGRRAERSRVPVSSR